MMTDNLVLKPTDESFDFPDTPRNRAMEEVMYAVLYDAMRPFIGMEATGKTIAVAIKALSTAQKQFGGPTKATSIDFNWTVKDGLIEDVDLNECKYTELDTQID